MATHAKNSTGPAFANATDLGKLVSAAAEAGLREGNKKSDGSAVWSDKELANARSLASAAITTLAGSIKQRSSLQEAFNDLGNSSAVHLVSDTDLNDDDKVAESRTKAGDATELTKAQYVSVVDDSVTIAPMEGKSASYTLTQFATTSGVDLSGQTLSTLSHVTLPLSSTAMALPRAGGVVALALEIRNTVTGGVLQGAIDKVKLTRGENGMVSATILDSSKLHLFMKTASDIQFGTGTQPLEGVGTPLLTNGADGLGIDLQKLASGMRKHFPDNTSLINKVLEESGTFEIKVVVADMDFRHADGTRLATGKVSVQVPGNLGVARAVQGVTVSGFVKF
jgi:hypothetical protein